MLAACGTQPEESVVPASPTIPPLPTKTPPPTATPDISPTPVETIDEGHPGLPLPQERGDFFSGSGACTICHAKMSSDTGADVSLDSYWRSTMMANAARDPYWQASLAAEVMENPALQSEIEDQCAKCHMPMGRFTAREKGDEVRVLGEDGFLDPDSTLHDLAMDGVSCSLCHQIRETGLGSSVTYSGDFVIDTELRMPDRLIFGPFTVEDNQADIMQSVSGFRPEQGLHLTGSTFCATCHTLYTPYVDATGQIAGEFPEQVSYFEWFYSDYRRSRPCQDCHMPEAEGGVKIANTSEVLRSPFALHSFVGGNAYMLEILKTFPDELGVTASSEHFDATIERTRRQLGQETAEITLEEVRLSGTFLTVDVDINNLVGHKFPTGFPARRAWIHFAVRDASGQVVFESGAPNPDGSIIGNDNDADPSVFEQHYSAIVQPEQVQIYEAILLNSENRITTTLLEAARYRKDNRLLPSGFEKAAPYEDIAVRGNARDDEDFEGGGDEIRYVVNVGAAQGPFKVTVDLLYQSVGYRWVDNLRSYETPLVNRFIEFYDAVPNLPVVVASASAEVGG